MSKQAIAAKADIRDSYIEANCNMLNAAVPAEVIADLRHFAKRRDEGRSISKAGLLRYFEKERNFKVGGKRLFNIAKDAGIDPWWAHA